MLVVRPAGRAPPGACAMSRRRQWLTAWLLPGRWVVVVIAGAWAVAYAAMATVLV